LIILINKSNKRGIPLKEDLIKYCNDIDIKYVGIADIGPYDELEKILIERYGKGHLTGFEEKNILKRVDPIQTMENVKSIIVCLFPYYIGEVEDSNISKYTYGMDYHIYVKEKLNQIGEYLSNKIDDFEYMSFVDTGPLADRYLAYKAGLGFFGINSNIINDEYGSYVFIGYILNNYPFEFDKPLDKTCYQCFRCVRECPGQIILGNFDINPMRCKSFLTQKKDELSEDEYDVIKKTKLVFGCDVCQDVCPHNIKVKKTNIKEFSEDLIFKIDYEELSNMSNKGFVRNYKNRAFSWRGRKVIKRNFDIIKNK